MGARTGAGAGGPAVAGRRSYDGGDADRARMWDLVAAAAGLVFIALIVASFVTPDTPAADGSADQIAAQLDADRAGHQASLLLGFLGDIAFLVFLAGFWSRLRRFEGAAGMFSGLFAIAGAVFVATIAISAGLYLALVQGAETSGDPAVLPTLSVLNDWVGACTVPAGVAMFIGATGAVLTTRALPAWLGWLGAVTGLFLLVSLAGVLDSDLEGGVVEIFGFGGFLLFLVWTLAASLALLFTTRRTPEPTPREPGAAAQAA